MKKAVIALILLALSCLPAQAFVGAKRKPQAPPASIENLKAEAEKGSARAMAELAMRYEFGDNAPQDVVRAYMWFSLDPDGRYLDQFDALAATMTPQQIEKATQLAAETQAKIDANRKKEPIGTLCLWNWLAEARAKVANCSSGARLPQNLEEAYFWLTLAKDASGARNHVGMKLTQAQRSAIRKRVAAWKPAAAHVEPLNAAQKKAIEKFASAENHIEEQIRAQNGYPSDEFIIGTDSEYGLHQPRDYREAEKWYLKAAAQGNQQAQENLGLLYSVKSDGGYMKQELLDLLDTQIGRLNYDIAEKSKPPVTKEQLEQEIRDYKLPYGCMLGDDRGPLDMLLPPEKLRRLVDDITSRHEIPDIEPCL